MSVAFPVSKIPALNPPGADLTMQDGGIADPHSSHILSHLKPHLGVLSHLLLITSRVCTRAEPHSMCPVFGHRVPRPIWASFEAPRSHRGPCATDKGQFGVAVRGGTPLSRPIQEGRPICFGSAKPQGNYFIQSRSRPQ